MGEAGKASDLEGRKWAGGGGLGLGDRSASQCTPHTQSFIINKQAFLHLVFKIVPEEWVELEMKQDGPCVGNY